MIESAEDSGHYRPAQYGHHYLSTYWRAQILAANQPILHLVHPNGSQRPFDPVPAAKPEPKIDFCSGFTAFSQRRNHILRFRPQDWRIGKTASMPKSNRRTCSNNRVQLGIRKQNSKSKIC